MQTQQTIKVAALILHSGARFLASERAEGCAFGAGFWNVGFGGKMEDETFLQALKREVTEEAGEGFAKAIGLRDDEVTNATIIRVKCGILRIGAMIREVPISELERLVSLVDAQESEIADVKILDYSAPNPCFPFSNDAHYLLGKMRDLHLF